MLFEFIAENVGGIAEVFGEDDIQGAGGVVGIFAKGQTLGQDGGQLEQSSWADGGGGEVGRGQGLGNGGGIGGKDGTDLIDPDGLVGLVGGFDDNAVSSGVVETIDEDGVDIDEDDLPALGGEDLGDEGTADVAGAELDEGLGHGVFLSMNGRWLF